MIMKKLTLFTGFVFWLAGLQAQSLSDNYLKGVVFIEKRMYSEAVESFSRAIYDRSNEADAFLKRGEANYFLNNMENALADFNSANAIRPGTADFFIARIYSATGDYDKALEFLEKHLSSESRLPASIIKKDSAFNDLKFEDSWYLLWQKQWYSAEEIAGEEVTYYLERSQFSAARNYLNSEISKNPASAELYYLRGLVDLTFGNYLTAVTDLTNAVKLGGNIEKYIQNRGHAYLKAGRFREALDDYNFILKTNRTDVKIHLNRAEAYAGMTDFSSAVKDVQTYLKYYENDMDAIYKCGDYCFQQKDYMNALRYFNQNLALNPDNALYLKARGKTYLMTRTYRYAIFDLSMSLDLDPNDAETWFYIGLSRLESGDRFTACSDFEKAVRLGDTKAITYIIDNCR